ncbi:Gag-Pol polyprotein, partial [Acropora cervicornis]
IAFIVVTFALANAALELECHFGGLGYLQPSTTWPNHASRYGGRTCLLFVEYYSRWVEIKLLTTQTARSVIIAIKELLSTHGIPNIVIPDIGPFFSAACLQRFADKYGFVHTTSSPRYVWPNGGLKRAIRTEKGPLKKNDGPHL